MTYSPAFDSTGVVVIMYLFIRISLTYIIMIIVEASILRQMNWGSSFHSLGTAILMNYASIIVLSELLGQIYRVSSRLSIAGFILLVTVSAVVEGGVIMFLMKEVHYNRNQVWLLALGANIVKNSLLAVWVVKAGVDLF